MSVITDQLGDPPGASVSTRGLLAADAYGSLSGSNASPAIQAQVDREGRFVLPAGDFRVQDPIVMPEGANGGASYGAGQEKSRLIADDMTGTAVIKCGQTHHVRLAMSDFGIVGNGTVVSGITTACDHAMDLSVGSAFFLNRSQFRGLNLKSNNTAFKATREFSTHLERVDAHSVSGHCFELSGDVGTSLHNCYAGRIGAGKAGYRIRKTATLIACNGVDETVNDCFWGWFGDNTSGSEAVYEIQMIGCNLEDFGTVGLKLEYSGLIVLDKSTFFERAAGTYRCAILAANGAEHFINIGPYTRNLSKGATQTGEKLIISDGGTVFIDVVSTAVTPQFTEYYRTSTAATVAAVNVRSLRP